MKFKFKLLYLLPQVIISLPHPQPFTTIIKNGVVRGGMEARPIALPAWDLSILTSGQVVVNGTGLVLQNK